MVDSSDQKKLLKSINKSVTWTTVTTRTKKIARIFPDLDNDLIYFVDCDYDRTSSYVWKLDTTDDSISEVDSAPDNIYDIFMIGTNIYMIYFSSSYEILTTIIRPDSDNDINWDIPSSPTTHFDRVNEVVVQPTVGDGIVNFTSGNKIDKFNFDNIDLSAYDSGKVINITIWAYTQAGANYGLAFKGNQTGTISWIDISGTANSQYKWDSASWTGLNLTDANINNLTIEVKDDTITTNYLDTIYIIITFEGDLAAKLYIKNITADTSVSQNMGVITDRSYDMGQVVVVGTDAYFLWKWSDEDVELWKYNGTTITQKLSSQTDFGTDTNLPPIQQWALAYDESNIISMVIGNGKEEISTINCTGAYAGVSDGEYINFQGIDENGDTIDYYVWFDTNGDSSGDPAPVNRIGIRCDTSGASNDQTFADALQAVINISHYFTAGNSGGTSTTVTMQNVYNGSVTDIADVDTGLAVAVSVQGINNTYHYHIYSISADTFTKKAEYNVALMLDRNTVSGVQEKAFHITNFQVYQIGYSGHRLYKIFDGEPSSRTIIAISDNFMFVDNSGTIEIWERVNISNKIKEVIIDTKTGQISTSDVITSETIATGQTIEVFDDSDNLQFIGAAYKRDSKDGKEFIYKCVGYDKEISRKYTASYTSKTAKQIMQYILDGDMNGNGTADVDLTSFLYYSSSIDNVGSFTTTYTLTFKNKTIKEIYDTLMDFEDGVWCVAPDGKVYAFALVDIPASGETITQSSNKIYGAPPEISQMMWELNKISLYGAIVSGARLQNEAGYGEDISSQQINGINEFLRHYPHVDVQATLNTLADAVLTRTGLTNNPIYVIIAFKEIGFEQVGKTLNFQFTPYPDLVTATDYYILSQRYYAKDDVASLVLSSGIIQEGREHEATLNQTSDADEEQIDIIATQVNKNTFPIGIKIDYFGTGIKGTISTRNYEISIANGDDFDMKGWFVANGYASTPPCLDKFTRNEATSGVIGCSDNALIVSLRHGATTYTAMPNSAGGNNPGGLYGAQLGDTRYTKYEGVSGAGKNIPAKISAIPIIKMS
jgi:hypothetical protein